MATKTLKILLLVTLVLSASPTALSARTPTADSSDGSLPEFADVDKDHSGGLDAGEASTVRGFDFKLANVNCDGQITRPEYEAVRDQMSSRAE